MMTDDFQVGTLVSFLCVWYGRNILYSLIASATRGHRIVGNGDDVCDVARMNTWRV